jgi:arylsulfatase A-like enzyme
VTTAALAFCSVIVLAMLEGFGAPAFRGVVASDAFSAAMPFLGLLLVARFSIQRWPQRELLVHRMHTVAQGLVAGASFGWWWIEPHSALASATGGTLAAMGWASIAGANVGFVVAYFAERVKGSAVFRDVALGAWAFFLVGGGRIYRAHDHIEAGVRLQTAAGIVAGTLLVAAALYLLLRRREKLASALPALAPAVACVVLFTAPAVGPAEPSSRESVLVVVIDTLRADIADGAFRADPDAMPELRRIAAQGTRFTQAVSPAPWTLPATVSLLSGWNPLRHRYGASASEWEVLAGDPAALYLAGAMRDAGYLTAGFFNNPYLRPWFGLDAGFLTMRPYHGRALDGVALAMDWLRGHAGSASFAVLHLMDPHWPYEAPAGFGAERQPCAVCDSLFWSQFGQTDQAQRAEIERRYAAEVRYTDAMLGRLYDTLDAGGALDRTWLVVTSDHGEELWEHGQFLHGHALHDELLRVPLVVVPPKLQVAATRGRRIDAQVRLEDVAATVLDIAGLDTARAVDGRSLLPLLSGAAEKDVRVSVAGFVKKTDDLRSAVRRPPWKAVLSRQSFGANQLFQLVDDPGEKKNLLFDRNLPPESRRKVDLAFLMMRNEPKRLGLEVDRTPAVSSTAAPDADTRRQLRSLGYAE